MAKDTRKPGKTDSVKPAEPPPESSVEFQKQPTREDRRDKTERRDTKLPNLFSKLVLMTVEERRQVERRFKERRSLLTKHGVWLKTDLSKCIPEYYYSPVMLFNAWLDREDQSLSAFQMSWPVTLQSHADILYFAGADDYATIHLMVEPVKGKKTPKAEDTQNRKVKVSRDQKVDRKKVVEAKRIFLLCSKPLDAKLKENVLIILNNMLAV